MAETKMENPAVPDHELIRRVGQGSYGEVWLARNVMGSFRAVKVVYRSRFESDRPYERELGGLQKFEPVSRTHPGLVSILHIGRNVEAGYFYCVMEAADDLARGHEIEAENYQPRTLGAELARRGRLPVDECLELGLALAAALGHLHSQGLVHRDIKPSNIIFVGGAPKLADIGLVTQIGARATFVGTEGYIPPEGPGEPAADLYSLGKVMYEISMGKGPGQFPELPTRLRELPEAGALMRLNSVVLKACEPHAARRFRSAEELRLALLELRTELPRPPGERLTVSGTGASGGLRVVVVSGGGSSADGELARQLSKALMVQGCGVFVDEDPELTVEWARRVEQRIRTAEIVVPILSVASMGSELLAYALEVAQQASRRPAGLPRVVPFRTAEQLPLPLQVRLTLGDAPSVGKRCDSIAEFVQVLLTSVESGSGVTG
jgi:serine/threonine protein kinase